jgi:hypothetical protein
MCIHQAHLIEPHRLCGMELHSTILWHLKREVRDRDRVMELHSTILWHVKREVPLCD